MMLGQVDVCVCVLSLFSHVQLCSPSGSSVHGSLQTILEWVAMPSSKVSSWLEIKPASLMSPALTGRFFTTSAIWEDSAKRCVPQLLRLCSRAKEPQPLSLCVLEPVLGWLQRNHCKEKPPFTTTREKPEQQWRPAHPINK